MSLNFIHTSWTLQLVSEGVLFSRLLERSHLWSLLFKNVGERCTAKNYFPVSLLAVVSKVFEKLGNKSIVDHLAGIFSSTFLLPVNYSKNSILNWVFKLYLFFVWFSNRQVIWNYKANYLLKSQLYLLITSLTRCLDPYIACSSVTVA